MSKAPTLQASAGTQPNPVRPGWGLSRFWWLVLFFWLIVSLASGLETLLMHMAGPKEVMMETIFRLLSWTFMTLLVVWLSSTYMLDHTNWKRTIWVYVAGCGLSLGLVAFLAYFGARPLIATSAGGSRSIVVSILMRLTYQVPTFWGLVAVAHAVRLYDRENHRKLRESELQMRLVQSRLQVLQLQLNPHFLFNTLNSIASLVHEDPAKAEKMIEALSELLRLAITITDRQQITLREELHFLDQYLFIQRIRFGDRLQVETQVDETLLDDKVPPLILQPLVENAIKHGVEVQLGSSLVRIALLSAAGGSFLRLEISNDGPIFNPSGGKIEERVGLTNTRARLDAMFGSRAGLELHPRETGGCVARILISRQAGAVRPSEFELQPARA